MHLSLIYTQVPLVLRDAGRAGGPGHNGDDSASRRSGREGWRDLLGTADKVREGWNDERKEITKDVLNEQLMEKTKGMTEEEEEDVVVMVIERSG